MSKCFLYVSIVYALVAACASPVVLPVPKQQVTAESYSNDKPKGLVAISVGWARVWKCAQFENAQLRAFGFDRLPIQTMSDDRLPDVLIEGSALYAERKASHYVLALDPGEYVLTKVAIKVASSVSDVKIGSLERSKLIHDGKPVGGIFTVAAGELVYIGHFGLDCYKEPMIWRYYPDGRDAFESYKKEIKKEYSFLDVDKMEFRLFKTSVFGQDYELR